MLTTMNPISHGRGAVYVWAKCSVCLKDKVVEIRPERTICEACQRDEVAKE